MTSTEFVLSPAWNSEGKGNPTPSARSAKSTLMIKRVPVPQSNCPYIRNIGTFFPFGNPGFGSENSNSQPSMEILILNLETSCTLKYMERWHTASPCHQVPSDNNLAVLGCKAAWWPQEKLSDLTSLPLPFWLSVMMQDSPPLFSFHLFLLPLVDSLSEHLFHA